MAAFPTLLFGAMEALKGRMGLAMEAAGCREGWLQAEIMMHTAGSEYEIWTNTEPVTGPDQKRSGSQKYDFSTYDEDDNLAMVAELKIMAGHFSQGSKCLLGARAGKWTDFEVPKRRRRVISLEETLASAPSEWGLVPDAARLLRHPYAPERHLILILLDLAIDENDSPKKRQRQARLHDVMDRVTFATARERTEKYDGFKVKIWSFPRA